MADENSTEAQEQASEQLIKSFERLAEVQKRYGGGLKDAVEKSVAELKNLKEGTRAYSKEQNKMTASVKKEFAGLVEGFKKGKRTADDMWDAVDDLSEAIKNTSDAQEKAALEELRNEAMKKAAWRDTMDSVKSNFKTATSSTVSGAATFVKGLQSGASSTELSLGLMNMAIDIVSSTGEIAGKALHGLGAAAAASTAIFGPEMLAVGGAINFLGDAIDASAKVSKEVFKVGAAIAAAEIEKNIKVFNELSASGALFAGGLGQMRSEALKAGLTVDQFASIVKGASGQLAASGMSVGEGARFTASVLNKGGDTMKRSMLKLGIGFEEQGALVADVIKDMRGASVGPLRATEAQVAAETQKYAENLRIIADITGEDAKSRMEEARNAANDIAFQAKLSKLSASEQQNIIEAMAVMTPLQKKNFMDMVVFGTVVNKQGAVMNAMNSGLRKSTEESYRLYQQHNLNLGEQNRVQKENGETMAEGYLKIGEVVGPALRAGIAGTASDVATLSGREFKEAQKLTRKGIEQAEKDAKDQKRTSDSLTNTITNAEIAAQGLRIQVQTRLEPVLEKFAEISSRMLNGIDKLMDDMHWPKGGAEEVTGVGYNLSTAEKATSRNIRVGKPLGGRPEDMTGRFATGSQREYYNKIYGTLLDQAKRAGVAHPDVIAKLGAAQSALETGYGQHLAGGNNYFGIKDERNRQGNLQSTQDLVNGKLVTRMQPFRKYKSMEESAADYINFLQKNSRYAGVLAAETPEEAIRRQGTTGYAAPGTGYAEKLEQINSRFANRTGAATLAPAAVGSTITEDDLKALDYINTPTAQPAKDKQASTQAYQQLAEQTSKLDQILAELRISNRTNKQIATNTA